MPLLDTLRRTLAARRPPLIEAGDRVLVATSGGPDSLSLLHALRHLRIYFGITDLFAAHLDHGLRGEESRVEAEFVAAFCAERGIPCVVETVDIAAMHGTMRGSKQEVARRARYEFLQTTAARLGANKIATGHTQDDQIETVLLNILRGTGPDGLKGIPVRRRKYIRPLLDTSRADIEAYCVEHGLSPRRDPSNNSPDSYTRNRIRLELLPTLERDYAPGVRHALLRLSHIAESDQEYLHAEAARELTAVTLASGLNFRTLDRSRLAALHPALLRYVLRTALDELRGTLDGITFAHIEQISEAVLGHSPAPFGITTPHPRCVIVGDTHSVRLTLSPPAETGHPLFFSIPLPVPRAVSIESLGIVIQAQLDESPTSKEAIYVNLDADQVDLESLVVRSWREGDRIDPLGMDGKSKKLQDIFTDAKLPRAERTRVPIIADKGGPLWIVGHTISERARTTAATRRALVLIASPQ